MADSVIVGGGFSALCCQLKNPDSLVITRRAGTKSNPWLNQIRPEFEINKLLGKKAYAHSSLYSKDKRFGLHARDEVGGNSSIWGGFIDVSRIPFSAKIEFEKIGIKFVPVSEFNTGSWSDIINLCQIQFAGEILDAGKLLNIGDYSELISVDFINKKKLDLNLVSELGSGKIMEASEIFLGVGVLKTIDILYRSKIISDKDILSIDEFNYSLALKFFPFSRSGENDVHITFDILRAVQHYLGIQKNTKLNLQLPFKIVQIFGRKINRLSFNIEGGLFRIIKASHGFGKSIHYCNLMVNGIAINDYIKSLDLNIRIIGMAAVRQIAPGPISQDILSDIWIK